MINNKKKNNKKIVIGLFILFLVLLGTTLFVSFSSLLDTQEVVVKSITPVYDENSGVVVDDDGVIFNDKNQVVKYNVVLENTQDYDVKISDINSSTPTEEFLKYEVEGVETDDVISANSTKELTVSFETLGSEGWGRNFADELTANISFEKIVKEVTSEESETPEEEDKQAEAPATKIEEIINKSEKIEINSITNNTIEFKDSIKLEDGEKAETWIYPETKFYGYKEADESNTIKEIVLEKDKLDELQIKSGEHNIVLATEEKEILGYVNVYIDEDKGLLKEKPQDTADKKEDEDGYIENPYTSDKGLLVVLIIATGVTGLGIILVTKNKFAKYTIFVIALSSTLTLVNAEEVKDVDIKVYVRFESQNVMSKAYNSQEKCHDWNYDGEIDQCYDVEIFLYFWEHNSEIKNIYIENKINEIDVYEEKFDVTEDQNGRVIAYLVTNEENASYYDLYLQADGIIYPNTDASYYFADMNFLDKIDNIAGLDTRNVTDMSGMFKYTGYNSTNFTLDVSNFDTSNVTDMSDMFAFTGYNSTNFTLDVSNFDTSKVTNMSDMFRETGYNSSNFTLDVGNFNTSNVTDMSSMFSGTGHTSETFTLDVSNFDTRQVTDMYGMFSGTGYSNPNFTLDVSNFDTNKVTNMFAMFSRTGYNSTNFTLDVSHFDTSNVTDMEAMFQETGFNSTKLDISITIKNPNTMNYYGMFYGAATKEGSQITVNYTSETEDIVDKMIATKSYDANVVKGVQVD